MLGLFLVLSLGFIYWIYCIWSFDLKLIDKNKPALSEIKHINRVNVYKAAEVQLILNTGPKSNTWWQKMNVWATLQMYARFKKNHNICFYHQYPSVFLPLPCGLVYEQCISEALNSSHLTFPYDLEVTSLKWTIELVICLKEW